MFEVNNIVEIILLIPSLVVLPDGLDLCTEDHMILARWTSINGRHNWNWKVYGPTRRDNKSTVRADLAVSYEPMNKLCGISCPTFLYCIPLIKISFAWITMDRDLMRERAAGSMSPELLLLVLTQRRWRDVSACTKHNNTPIDLISLSSGLI